jgi:aldehyde:ferredoxin oxidoreductase
MMFGWKGKIASIDLTGKTVSFIQPDIELLKKYIGGKGLAGYYLTGKITLPYDSPEMPLIFMTGPLVDTPAPVSGRMTVMSRSPQTGTVGDTSVGGKLAFQIKRSGLDGIIITGISESLCGIEINNSEIKFTDASSMLGKKISEISEMLPAGGSFASTGPAAENGVLFANIAIDSHFMSGRNGLGLVMSSKKLKYIHVMGSGKTEIFNPDEVMKAKEEIFRLAAASSILKGELGISEYGTGALYDLMHSRRMMPTDNFRKTYFDKASGLNAFAYKEKYDTKKTGCSGCHIMCKKKGANGEIIPEFETMSHFTALLDNNDIDTVMKANNICNEYGMDTITAASTLACYSEIEDVKLTPETILSLLEDIALSRGIGEELKHGSCRYAFLKGKESSSISVKGLELPAYDPRGAYGMAIAYATSTRGACHLRAYPISHEILRKPVATDRFTFSGKARIIKLAEDINAVIDSLTACKFIFFAASLEEYAKAFSGVTGIKMSTQDLLKAGERIYYNDRIMNAANGFTGKDDDLPERFFLESGTGGDGINIPALNRDDFLAARKSYYKIRGLDENGMPVKEKCEELGLEWIF